MLPVWQNDVPTNVSTPQSVLTEQIIWVWVQVDKTVPEFSHLSKVFELVSLQSASLKQEIVVHCPLEQIWFPTQLTFNWEDVELEHELWGVPGTVHV